jgi:PAS domain S-box-containing protein
VAATVWHDYFPLISPGKIQSYYFLQDYTPNISPVQVGSLQNKKFSPPGERDISRILKDWQKSCLGEFEKWPSTLKNTILILSESKVPAVLFWTAQKFTFYNDAFKSAFSLPENCFPGQKADEIWGEEWPKLAPLIDDVLNGKEVAMIDSRSCQVFKSKMPGVNHGFSFSPTLNDTGDIEGVFVICTPVNESDEANARARLAIESADLGTFEIDLKTDKIVTSARFNQIWGVEGIFDRDQFASCIHKDDLPIRKKAHEDALITGNLSYEVRLVRNEDLIWVRVKGKVLRDREGIPSLLVGVVQDITEHKIFAEKLSKQVQERTEELQALNEELVATNEELSEANANLTKANGELEQFAYVASHDLQEPLRKIQIFTNILNERHAAHLPDDAGTYLSKIGTSAMRMANLIKDLLDYSRLTHNRTLFQQVDLNNIIENVIDDFEVLIKQKKITISAEALPVVRAIPIQMNQLFYNLIGNSIKFSKKGTEAFIAITVKQLTQDHVQEYPALRKENKYFEITVTDNGIGFSQQYAEQIFTIFQRLNDKSKYGGYGIGLALCKRIVQNHNGLIYAFGEQNVGASFKIILPQ